MSTSHHTGQSLGSHEASVAAAGAVLWRGSVTKPEVALVHRPAYDDWSFPKGKVDAGEHVIAAAMREIAEETGSSVRLGVRLPTARYTVRGVPKTVDYWAAEHIAGEFEPHAEIDDLRWLPVNKARSRLTHHADQRLLGVFAHAPLATAPVIAVRHAKARSRRAWNAPDQGRPLTPRGERQAEALAQILAAAFAPMRVISSPWLRCLQTVEPYAEATSATVELLDVLGEDEFEDDPGYAAAEIARVAAESTTLMLCSHGNVMADLVAVLCGERRKVLEPLGEAPLAKGEIVIVHRDGLKPVSAERHAF